MVLRSRSTGTCPSFQFHGNFIHNDDTTMVESNQASKYAREVFAKILDRIADRLLPGDANQRASTSAKVFATGAGVVAWIAYGLAKSTGSSSPQSNGSGGATDQQQSTGSSVEATFDPLPASWDIYLLAALAILAISIWICIATSFTRGRPLTFFFWGLIFPTIALNILRYAFP